ncbi:hypothetical protein G6M89_00185 [Natronolimnobius sp. AArcel1]|uniref:hypothetical protein n=1 Tax=Natronolimnobius sp. AArcel1 TaxID=1679093 RepID=UPI0013EC60D9|nr:hypothetical protein [Natronolimnobius sp. AArcel1]
MTNAALSIAGMECRRTIRAVTGDRTKILVMAAIGVFAFGPLTVVALLLLPELGEEVAAGAVDSEMASMILEIVPGVVAVVWLFAVLMAAIRTVTTAAKIDKPACLLISTRLRNVVVGVVGAEIVLFSLWVVPPAVVLSSAFASGTGTILPVVIAPLVVVLLLVTAVPVGFVIGVCFRHLITVYEPIARYRTPLLALLALAYFGSIATGWFNEITAVLFDLLGDGPLGWPGHLLLVAIPGISPSSTAAIGALVATAVVAPLAIFAGEAVARVHWYADPARTGDETVSDADSSNRLAELLSYGLAQPTRTVAVTAIRRTKRAPIRLAYVAYPLFGTLFFAQEIIQTGTVPTYLAVLLCLYVVWGAGVLFTLNPLGDLGQALSAVLTSTLSGTDAIRGRMIAGSLVGVPVAIIVAIAMGLVSPLSLEATGALVVGSAVGALVTPGLAAGIGSVFPRFGTVKVTNNSEAVMPSKMAFLVYTVAIMLPAGAATVLYTDSAALIAEIATMTATIIPQVEATFEASTVTTLSWTILVIGLIAPPVAYRYAVERFDWYRLE